MGKVKVEDIGSPSLRFKVTGTDGKKSTRDTVLMVVSLLLAFLAEKVVPWLETEDGRGYLIAAAVIGGLVFTGRRLLADTRIRDGP